MRADQNIDLAVRHFCQNLFLLFGGFETGKHFDIDRIISKTIFKILKMLLCQQGCRGKDCHLFMVHHRQESRSHCHFSFTKADIATHKAIHRFRQAHIANYRIDCRFLIFGFFKRERVAKLHERITIVLERKAFLCLTFCIDIKQLRRHITNFLRCFLTGFRPRFRSQFM